MTATAHAPTPPAAGGLKPSEALRKARELITPEGAWTQKFMAKTSGKSLVRPKHQEAVCWCSLGAIDAVTETPNENSDARDWLVREIWRPITEWNDAPDRTHAEVLDAFDRAAALAEAEGH